MGNVIARAFSSQFQHHRCRLRFFCVLLMLYLTKKLFGPALLTILMRWHYTYTAETPKLVYRKTPANKKLLSHCITMTQQKYYPPWYMFNGHLQTVAFARDKRGPKINYQRQLLDMPDGGVVSLDWALLPGYGHSYESATDSSSSWIDGVDPTRRTVLLMPGLTGGSSEIYIRRAIARLHELGWQCTVLNARGCANTPVKTPQLFCTAYTKDIRFVLQQLSEKYNFAQEAFIAVGFSMGSNVLVKYLGEERDQTPLTGAISVGNPFDLPKVAANLSSTMFNRFMYDKALNCNMRALFFDKSNAAEQFEGYPDLDMEAIRASRTVREFDETCTKILFNYNSADHFYEDASSVKKLRSVCIPLLCISAEDDPICVNSGLPSHALVEACPNVILCVTKSGGHLAFYESPHDQGDGDSKSEKVPSKQEPTMWSANPIAEFAEAVRLNKAKA
ncbi:hypothetical protein BBO99_00001332 [Phytophthora kernoviae]|uniref:AB hydrolase-1 domain-containing protein n=2 Tax=Phytophthora kernoviae TaxID=325452 RepID=A0A421GZQ0_9STRA|nr:hypothetical protein G195_002319 [Phytophthora kernoviae 00238/432]KAG2529604.1 hypothetical protein JM16_001988 [Phytophthora kernoviae]KAG2530788.1 hypothetical protein JM18_001164 [Phytophthora kernoviae]RLN10299.1 hypothetical protein BBI17_001179 [Phytophthora kernoviae]RLN84399.1 hypothetical protein BBO99_00001332 [Phytophthora kernoviae]